MGSSLEVQSGFLDANQISFKIAKDFIHPLPWYRIELCFLILEVVQFLMQKQGKHSSLGNNYFPLFQGLVQASPPSAKPLLNSLVYGKLVFS